MLAPLLGAVERDLHISHSEAGSFFFFLSAGYFLSLVLSGLVSKRLAHRGTVILSASLVGAALLGVALSRDIGEMRGAMFLLGAAAGLYLPSGISTVTGLVRRRDWGKALGIHELAPNLAFLSAPLIAQAILSTCSWRVAPALLGGLSLVLAVAFKRFGKGGRSAGTAPGKDAVVALVKTPRFWLMAGVFSVGITGTLGVYTMLPLYLSTEAGLTEAGANTLVGLSRSLSLGMALVAGYGADRLGARRTMGVVFAVNGAATILLGVASGVLLKVMVFLQPAVAVCFFPAGFVALSRVGPPEARNVAVSLTVPLGFLIGGGAVPYAIGAMGDLHTFAAGMVGAGFLILSGSILAWFVADSE